MLDICLENNVYRILLDPDTGGFRSMTDKRSGREYIAAPEQALLFRLMIPRGEEQYRHMDGRLASAAVSDDGVALRYASDGLRADVTLTLEPDAVMAQLHLYNESSDVVEEVMFPWIRGVAPLPEAEFTWPCFWKRRYRDVFGKELGGDHRTWNDWTQKLMARYPSHLASAWCNYGNEAGGIALEGRHQDFSIMDFYVHKTIDKTQLPARRSLDFCIVHPRRVKPGETYVSPPVRISLHSGDWHSAASAHRQWLASWILKPERPAAFAESIGWHFFFMKHQDGWVAHEYAALPDMARAALTAGCRYLLLFGWQTGGHDNNYFYRYIPNEDWGGAAALRQAVEACRALGVELIPFFNGTLANTEMPEHKAFGHRWEAKTRTGHPYYAGDWARHNFDAITRNRAMLHTEIAFCAEQRAYVLDAISRMIADYGFGNLQLDQISEKMLVDYHEEHIETTPDRVYVDGLRALLPAIRQLLRDAHPDGVIISEVLNDFTGQWCDSSWDWNILIPEPEPILYTLPWLMASHEIDANEYDDVNKAFAYKMHLDMKIDGGDAPIAKYPGFAAHIHSLAALRARTSAYHAHAEFRDQDGIGVEGPESVFVKKYVHEQSGKGSVVLAETAGEAATVVLTLSDQAHAATAVLESNQRAVETVRVDAPMTIAINPWEVRMLLLEGPPTKK